MPVNSRPSPRLAPPQAVHPDPATIQPSISPVPRKILNKLILACYPAPVFAATQPRPLVSPSTRDLCGRRLPGLPRASREPGRNASALDCYFSFVLSNLQLSAFDSQLFPPLSPLSATLMDLPVSVANKRLTAWLSPLSATLTKNTGWGVFFPFWNVSPAQYPSVFSTTYALPILQALSFDGLPSNGGCRGCYG
jgi:hypothetical protein